MTASDGTGSRERSDNELIAEFMGVKVTWIQWLSSTPRVLYTCDEEDGTVDPEADYPYDPDKDWNLLMDVCKKWDELPFLDYGELMRYQIDLCNKLDGAVTQYEIEPAFRQLVENIRWYNNQKQQSS